METSKPSWASDIEDKTSEPKPVPAPAWSDDPERDAADRKQDFLESYVIQDEPVEQDLVDRFLQHEVEETTTRTMNKVWVFGGGLLLVGVVAALMSAGLNAGWAITFVIVSVIGAMSRQKRREDPRRARRNFPFK